MSRSLLGKSCEQNPRASVKLVQRALSAATNFSAGMPLISVHSLNSRGRDPQASVAKTLWNASYHSNDLNNMQLISSHT